ncbi:MAG: hypothetical protein NXI16_02695 [Alphaproteobacteria bacterium]|nr:hypothetical protein [Alphaproteobacteria bacterium]
MADIPSVAGGVTALQNSQPSARPRPLEDQPTSSRFKAQDFRLASASSRTAFEVDLSGITDKDAMRDKVAGALTDLFQVFFKGPELEKTVGTALESLGDVLDKALDSEASPVGIQIGLARVDQFFGELGDDPLGARISQFAVEVGVVTDGRINAENVGLVDLSGERIAVTEAQQKGGVATSVYQIDGGVDVPNQAQTEARQQALLDALDRLVQVNDALAAFREGDLSGLQRLEQLLRGERDGPGLRSADAIGRLRGQNDGETERVFPGSGIVRG